MDTAKTIKELRESTGMSRKEFSEHTGIPVRTLEDWEAGRRTPPEYIPRLLAYQIKIEKGFSSKGEVKGKRSVSVIQDVDGNNIVIINDIRFKGKRSIDWKDVREYLKEYVGEFYTIAATGDVIYIGLDLPNEYSGSKYTHSIKGANAKAKANAAQGIPELIEIAVGKHFRENNEEKHWRNAKYGWYRYDSRFALPVYNETGEIERYNVFHASLIVRHSEDKKLYLYDILDIKKETSNPIEPYGCTRQKTHFFYKDDTMVKEKCQSDYSNVSVQELRKEIKIDIKIREWKIEDKSELAGNLNNMNILNNLRDGLPYPYTEADAEKFIRAMLSADKDNTFAFAITLDDKVIGSIGVFRQENIHYRTAEMGYYIGEKYWGNGYMTEAVKMACNYVFENTDIIRIYAEPFAYNTASCRVLEKAGFVCEGILKRNAYKNGNIVDMKMYAIVKQ